MIQKPFHKSFILLGFLCLLAGLVPSLSIAQNAELADKYWKQANELKKEKKYLEAAKLYSKSAEAEKASPTTRLSELGYELNQAGLCYYNLSQYKKAIPFFKESQDVFTELKNEKMIATLTGNLQDSHSNLTKNAHNNLRRYDKLRVVIQLGQVKIIRSVAFSPDGRYVLTGSEDKTAKLWDSSSGREIRTFKGHSSMICSVAFSPDGRYVLTGSNDKTAKLWDSSSGREIRTFKGHLGWIYSVAFSPDGRYVLTASNDKTAKLWDTGSGREIRTFKGHSFWIKSVAFSPDGRYILTGSWDKTAKLWDSSSGREIRTFKGHSENITSVAFSPDGRYVLTGSWDHTAKLWNSSSGREIRTFKGHSKIINSVAFSPDGRYVLTGSEDKTAKLWDSSSGREIRTFKGHSKIINSVAFSPDGRYVLTGSWDHTAKLWDSSSGREIRAFKGGSSMIESVAFSPDGRHVLTGSEDKTAKLWDASSGRKVHTFKGHSKIIKSVAFSPDGRYVLTGSRDTTAKLWDSSSGREIRTFKEPPYWIESVAFSPDGRYVLMTGNTDHTAKLWDSSSGREIRTFKGHSSAIKAVAFSPDGRYVLTGSRDTTAKLWDSSSGREIRTFKGHSYWISSVAFSSDGRYVLTGSTDHTAKLWDSNSGREIHTFKGHSSWINSVAFSPDGRYVLTGSTDETAKLWDSSSGREIRTFKGRSYWITSVTFSPDGRYILTGSWDNTAKLWDANSGNEICQFLSTIDGEWIVSTPDGYYMNSPEGTDLIHWVSQDETGYQTYSFEQFESHFKRPAIIKARLAGDLDAGKPAPIMTPPPSVQMDDHMAVKETSDKTYPLKLQASALKTVEHVRVFVNGKPTVEIPVHAREKVLSVDVPLFPGANKITVVAYDEKGFSSSPRSVDVTCNAKGLAKPELYVLAIGVSEYPRMSKGKQLKYAHSDAEALVDFFHNQEGTVFDKVYSSVLTNQKANLELISEELDSLSEIKENDIAIIFLAGHGAKSKDGTFYFVTPAGTIYQPETGGLNWDILNNYLANIKGRVILFLDACHAGSINQETIVPNDELAQKFFSKGKSGVMVFSASKGRQISREALYPEGGFGAFTRALLQGMGHRSGEADTNNNNYVEFMELTDYVQKEVDKEMQGRQTPWLSRKELFGDFPLVEASRN